MSESTEVVAESQTMPVRSLIVPTATLEAYQRQTLVEARERVRLREIATLRNDGSIEEAERALQAARDASLLEQQFLWQSRLRGRKGQVKRRLTALRRAEQFLSLVEDGYLPIPRQEATGIRWLRDPLPAEVLQTIGTEQEHGRFQEFEVIGLPSNWQQHRQRDQRNFRGRDPILVGICDGEMFPLAWWR